MIVEADLANFADFADFNLFVILFLVYSLTDLFLERASSRQHFASAFLTDIWV